jgi:chaperonin cofactor prefoldin
MPHMTALPNQTNQWQQEAMAEATELSNLEFEAAKLEAVKTGLEEIKNNKNPVWHSASDMDTWFNVQRQSIK